MKKSKTLKLTSSLAVLTTVTPIVATSCTTNNKNTDLKVDINEYEWHAGANYNSLMSNEEIISAFKENNKTLKDGGTLPNDIYDDNNVEIKLWGNAPDCTVEINAKDSSELYKGSKSVELTVQKDINQYKYETTGNYLTLSSDADYRLEFIKNNPTDLWDGQLPDDFYNNVDVKVEISPNNTLNFTLNAKNGSNRYFGEVKLESLNVKINIEEYEDIWNFAGNYNALMTLDEIKAEFWNNNKIGVEGGLPADIVDSIEISTKGSGMALTIILTADGIKYGGKVEKLITTQGAMVYDGKKYILSEQANINQFCGQEELTVTTADGELTITDHRQITELYLPADNTTTQIGDSFLYSSHNLKKLDISQLTSIKVIGKEFLMGCSSLKDLQLPSLEQVTSIGQHFLAHCSALNIDLDLTSLKNLTEIPKFFLIGCNELKTVNLSGLTSITKIGDNFLAGFKGSLDMSEWTQKTTLNDVPFPDTLTSLNLSGWTSMITPENVKKFPNSLTSLDLSGWTSMTTVKAEWWPANLGTLNLSGWTSITNMHTGMFSSTTKNIDLSGWTGLKTIGDKVFSDNEVIQSLNLSGAINLETIGEDFFWIPPNDRDYDQYPFSSINLSGLTNLKSIGLNFVAGSFADGWTFPAYFSYHSVKSFDFSSLTSLANVVGDFLQNEYKAQTIDFSGFENVKTFGKHAFEWCNSMVWLKLPHYHDYFAGSGHFGHEIWYRFANEDYVKKGGLFVVPKGEKTNWDNYLEHKVTSGIIEEGEGYMTYNGNNYLLADNIDPNIFCGDGTWYIPTKNNGTIAIPKSKRNQILTFALPETVKATKIGNNFLSGCTKLAHLSLTGFDKVKVVGDNFLENCNSIQTLKLTNLSNVARIGNNFLHNCSSLWSTDFSTFKNVIEIDSGFLSGCTNITQIKLFNQSPATMTVEPENFMQGIKKYAVTVSAGDNLAKYK